MKKYFLFVMVTVSSWSLVSCERGLKSESGESIVSFETKALCEQASAMGLDESDIGSFLFEVTDTKGVVYSGLFRERPEIVKVRAGECSFSLRSRIYSGPEFDKPLYGDYLVTDVTAGEDFEVLLSCRQLTSGVQIIYSQDFKDEYPDGFVRITCRDTLTNDVEETDYHLTRTGFCHFLPGLVTVNLIKEPDAVPELLTGRYCDASDMFSVTVRMAPMEASGTVRVKVDTVLFRSWETYSYGRKRTGKSVFDAISVSDLPDFEGDTVWVAGYVSGYFINKKWYNLADTSAVTANIALSSSPYPESASPVAVSVGKCKALNLKEHPELFGERVAILGIPGKLYELDGIKKSQDYVLL